MDFLVSNVRFERSMVVDTNRRAWRSSIAEGELKAVHDSRIESSSAVWAKDCSLGVKRHGNWAGEPKRVE